jgi:polyisoprenoid-binding protein YceI
MKKLSFVFLAAALAFAGCKKKPEEAKAPPAPAEPAPAPAPAPEVKPPEPTPAPAPAPAADSISVFATHAEPKPVDPVEVKISTFKVVKADFDPAKVEGGTAELELDLNSISTNDEKRTGHLKTPDYIDVAKFAIVNVKIDNVKKTGDNKYSADASIKFHGVEKKYPIAFDVTETTADGIRIQLEHKFNKNDFGVGKDSKDPKVEGVASELTIKASLGIKKT